VGKASGGAGGYGHALGERTSGRAAGGHEGDGHGQWKRGFEFPSISVVKGLEASVNLAAIGCDLVLADVYERVL